MCGSHRIQLAKHEESDNICRMLSEHHKYGLEGGFLSLAQFG